MKDALQVKLPAQPSDDLRWDLSKIEKGKKISWEFELGLELPYFPLEDEFRFQTLKQALAFFSEEVFPLFLEETAEIILYRGAADFSAHFCWSERQETNWNSWKKERPNASEKHLRRLFCADAFALYFQMLSHSLPDEVPIALYLNAKDCGTPAEIFQLVSKERFEHFQLTVEGIEHDSKAPFAICFPEEAKCSGEVLAKMDALLANFSHPFRVIPEPFLTEQWEGVETLCVLPETVTDLGKRKLLGFCAAGGNVIEFDGSNPSAPSFRRGASDPKVWIAWGI